MDIFKHTSRQNKFLELIPGNELVIASHILSYMRNGATQEQFFADFSISKTAWDKYIRKNKAIKIALIDGYEFYIAFWQRKALEWSRDKDRSQAVSKMLLENNLGWQESKQQATIKIQRGGIKGYKVIIKRKKKLPPMDGDGIPLSMSKEGRADQETIKGRVKDLLDKKGEKKNAKTGTSTKK